MASEEAHRAKSLIISEGYDDHSGFKRSRTTVCYFRVFCASGESPCKCTSYEEADKAKNHNKIRELEGDGKKAQEKQEVTQTQKPLRSKPLFSQGKRASRR